jgi:hypothetical protein
MGFDLLGTMLPVAMGAFGGLDGQMRPGLEVCSLEHTHLGQGSLLNYPVLVRSRIEGQIPKTVKFDSWGSSLPTGLELTW